MSEPTEQIPEPPRGDAARREAILDRFERAWQDGAPPEIDAFLPEGRERLPVLVELVHMDLEWRLKSGEPVRVERYLDRYPDLANDRALALDLLRGEYEQRRGQEPGLSVEEYQRRFPRYRDALAAWVPTVCEPATSSDLPPTLVHPVTPPALPRLPLPVVPGYEILDELGRGGMGVVYKARQTDLNRLVALKVLLAGAYARADDQARFRTEAEAVARLQHPNIVQIYEVGEQVGLLYCALEFVDGGTLAGRLTGGPWPARDAARFVETLARAMQYAHERGVLHRDLKPGNILLSALSDRQSASNPEVTCVWPTADSRQPVAPKITDFGLAKFLGQETRLTKTGSVMGTPSYMAPEQAQGHTRDIGPGVDIYALGVILYELLTARLPFEANTDWEVLHQITSQDPPPPSLIRHDLPSALEAICLKCLRKDPQQRYATAGALADDLANWLRGQAVNARRPGPTIWSHVRRHRVKLVGAGALLVVAMAYLAAADAGLTVPGGEGIRLFLDGQHATLLRPIPSDTQLRNEASVMRRDLVGLLQKRQGGNGWLRRSPDADPALEVWVHSKTLWAVFKTPEATPEQLQSFVAGLDAPFTPGQMIERGGVKYGWVAHPDLPELQVAEAAPALTTAGALAAALGRPGLLTESQRRRAEQHLVEVQDILKTYRPTETGGWNLFPRQVQPGQHDPYTTLLALLVLLEVRRAGLPWEGSADRRDTLIQQTAGWLVARFDGDAEMPGWRGVGESARTTQDGLTLQIYAGLLQAEREAGVQLPEAIVRRIPEHLARCDQRDLSFTATTGKYAILFTNDRGETLYGREAITFLWYPAAIDCAAGWLRRVEETGAPESERVAIRRVLGHLLGDLGPEAVHQADKDWTYIPAELLLALTAVPPA